jgi:DNA-binding XRE family transcriptional regulator
MPAERGTVDHHYCKVEATKAAQRVGIAHAKAGADNPYRGRKPSYTREQFETVRNMLKLSTPAAQIAKETGLSRQTIYRINEDPAASEAALTTWGALTSWTGDNATASPDVATHSTFRRRKRLLIGVKPSCSSAEANSRI